MKSSVFVLRARSFFSLLVRVLLAVGVVALFWLQGCGNSRTGSDGVISQDASTSTNNNNALPDTSQPLPENNVTQDNGPPAERKPPAETRCLAVLECSQTKCSFPPATSCLDQCAKDVVGGGQTLYGALKACLSTKCEAACSAGDATCLERCWKVECGQEWLACAVDGRAGSNSCRETSLCAINCDKKNFKCQAGCFANASQASQAAYVGFAACQGKAAQKPLTPQESQDCYNKEVACQCPESKPGSGSGTCDAYLKCVTPCGNKACCLAKCRAGAQASALQSGDALLNCIVAQCKSCPAGDQACVDKCAADKCTNSLFACLCPGVGAPGSGGGKCKAGLDCAQRCSTSDTCCGARCLASMSGSAYQKFNKLAQCLSSKCGQCGSDSKCLESCGQSKCSSEAISCTFN